MAALPAPGTYTVVGRSRNNGNTSGINAFKEDLSEKPFTIFIPDGATIKVTDRKSKNNDDAVIGLYNNTEIMILSSYTGSLKKMEGGRRKTRNQRRNRKQRKSGRSRRN
jgi:hypothetical protein